MERFVKKGSKLYIEGALQTRKWTDNSGIEKYTTEVILQGFSSKLEIVDNRKDGDGSNYSSSSYDDSHETPSGIEDDIPF